MAALPPLGGLHTQMSEQEAIGAASLFPDADAAPVGAGHASRTAAVMDQGGNSPDIPF